MADFTPIRAVSRTVDGLDPSRPGLLVVRIKLNCAVLAPWADIFKRRPNIEGGIPVSFHYPECDRYETITLRTPDASLEEGVRVVDRLIEATNEEFEKRVLPEAEARRAAELVRHEEKQRRLEDAQQRLDSLS